MKMSEVKSALTVPFTNYDVAMKDVKGTYINVIIKTRDNAQGLHITSTHNSLSVVHFKVEPYRSKDVMTGYERLTQRQLQLVRDHMINEYFS